MKKIFFIIISFSFQLLAENLYPGDTTYNVKYYKLNVKITTNPNYLTGSVIMSGVPQVNPLNQIFMDLQQTLSVDSVVSNGIKLVNTHQNAKVNITLDRTYQPNEQFIIEIFYRGVPGSSGFGSFEFGQHSGQPAIWTLSEPYGASDWWPCKDNPSDKADSADIWITCASNLKGISNGRLIETIVNGDGFTTYKWKEVYPIANYLIAVTISNYYEYLQYFKYSPTDSMPVVHYVYPENFPALQTSLDKTIDMLRIFSDKYGLYPFIKEKYGHVQFGWGGGMEHQTISSMGSFSEGIVSHELSHQWFGDKVTTIDWHHIWLNEGFATYSEGVYYEGKYGRDAYNSFINQEMNTAKYARGSIYVQNINSIDEIFNSARSYSKGGIVLHMLRGIVGDSIFFQSLREYLDVYAYSNASTEDLKNIFEGNFGSNLDYFFNEWIYGENFPVYSFNWNVNNNEGGVKLNIILNQQTNINPSFFTMPVELKIEFTNRDTIITLFNNQQEQSFFVKLNEVPQNVILDPNNKILKGYINNTGELPSSYDLKQNFPNPFNPITKIRFSMPERSRVVLKVYDVLGNLVKNVLDEERDGGIYDVDFSSEGLPSGVYFYTLYLDKFEKTRKMMILK
ncbi:MAG: M1 family aminopeptidase [Syntrophothermus sp.]